MCFDIKTSITAFVIGTISVIYGIFYYKDASYTGLMLALEFALLMQIFDAIAWSNLKCGTSSNKFATRGAFVANMMQPIIVFMALILVSKTSKKLKMTAVVIISIYVAWVLSTLGDVCSESCISPKPKCDHLNYYWWDKIKYGGMIYTLVLISMFLLLIRPFKFSIIVCVTTLILLFLSGYIYKCGTSTVWCFFVAFSPLLFLVIYKHVRD